MQPKLLDTIYKAMTPEVAKSKYGKKFTQYLQEIKKTAPESKSE